MAAIDGALTDEIAALARIREAQFVASIVPKLAENDFAELALRWSRRRH